MDAERERGGSRSTDLSGTRLHRASKHSARHREQFTAAIRQSLLEPWARVTPQGAASGITCRQEKRGGEKQDDVVEGSGGQALTGVIIAGGPLEYLKRIQPTAQRTLSASVHE